mmetsp:Transcript_34114/g.79754  ORF Transcript_34114/g.79754 Transcript_34114/m.79754 type:complete len:209 (+) Transcript_34114:3248-3874(+)
MASHPHPIARDVKVPKSTATARKVMPSGSPRTSLGTSVVGPRKSGVKPGWRRNGPRSIAPGCRRRGLFSSGVASTWRSSAARRRGTSKSAAATVPATSTMPSPRVLIARKPIEFLFANWSKATGPETPSKIAALMKSTMDSPASRRDHSSASRDSSDVSAAPSLRQKAGFEMFSSMSLVTLNKPNPNAKRASTKAASYMDMLDSQSSG